MKHMKINLIRKTQYKLHNNVMLTGNLKANSDNCFTTIRNVVTLDTIKCENLDRETD